MTQGISEFIRDREAEKEKSRKISFVLLGLIRQDQLDPLELLHNRENVLHRLQLV
jgi:hypothetical protein